MINNSFDHYILIRFNLSLKWLSNKKNNNINKNLDEEWLNIRFGLFKENLYKSLLAQDNKNAKVLVGMHRDTPVLFLNKMYELLCDDFFEIVLIETPDNFKFNIDSKKKYIITTRIDSDDLVHNNFISVIQENFVPIDMLVLNPMPLLYNFMKPDRVFLFKNETFTNQFISLIEENKEILRTVYFCNHTKVYDRGCIIKDIFNKKKEPLAIWNIHGGNTLKINDNPLKISDSLFSLYNDFDIQKYI